MGDISALPDEMFTIIKQSTQGLSPRLGRLSLPGRHAIQTPHYLASTSRGIVPHITPDTFRRDTDISSVYFALEDCMSPLFPRASAPTMRGADKPYLQSDESQVIERASQQTPPIYKFEPPDGSSPLRRFVALPNETLTVLGARRISPVIAPSANPNTNTSIAVSTAVGFRTLKAEDYADATERLRPDIVVGLGDVPYGRAVGAKRIEKGTDRMIEWMQHHVGLRKLQGQKGGKLFASLLPVSCAKQQFYIDCLAEDVKDDVTGLAVYSTDSLEDLPETLQHLPRLAFLEPSTPHQILLQVALGCDILTIPFTTAATDAGIALDFKLPAPELVQHDHEPVTPRQLGVDMWLTEHATDLSPLAKGCKCYACTNHHRAYLQHLLMAKEMLGWILLQIHNHHILDRFFESIRNSIAEGTFEAEVQKFERAYEPQLPEKTGQGPRVRGYQFKSEGPGEAKKNKAPFTMLDEGKEKLAEATPPSSSATASILEGEGFAERAE